MNTAQMREKAFDEAAVIDRAKAGDAEAVGELFVYFGTYVRRILLSLLGPDNDIDDVTQEVFIAVFRGIAGFEGRSRFTTWVHPIVVRCAIAHLRSRKRASGHERVHVDIPSGRDPHSDAVAVQMLARLHQILDSLPEKRRVAFVLFDIEGHSIEEVARLIGQNRAVAKSRIWFARRAVAKLARRDSWLGPLIAELSQQKGQSE